MSKRATERRVRLRVERLEERTVPATFQWLGAVSSHWTDLNNWSMNGGSATALPGYGDHVEISDTLFPPIIGYGTPAVTIGKLTSIGTGAELYIYDNILTIDACQCGPSVWNGTISCEGIFVGRTNSSLLLKGLADFRWTGGTINLMGVGITGGSTFSAEGAASFYRVNLTQVGAEEGLEVGTFAVGSFDPARTLTGHITLIEARIDLYNQGKLLFLDSHGLGTSGGIAWTPAGPPYSLITAYSGGAVKVLGYDITGAATRCDVPIYINEGGELLLMDYTRLNAGSTEAGFMAMHGVNNVNGAVEIGSGSVLTVRGLGYRQDGAGSSFTLSSGVGGVVGNMAVHAGLIDIGVFALGSEYATLIVDGNMSIGAATIKLHVHGSGDYEHDTLVVTQVLVLGMPALHVITVGEFVQPPVVVDDHMYQIIQAIGGFSGIGFNEDDSVWDAKVYEIDAHSDPSQQLIWLNLP